MGVPGTGGGGSTAPCGRSSPCPSCHLLSWLSRPLTQARWGHGAASPVRRLTPVASPVAVPETLLGGRRWVKESRQTTPSQKVPPGRVPAPASCSVPHPRSLKTKQQPAGSRASHGRLRGCSGGFGCASWPPPHQAPPQHQPASQALAVGGGGPWVLQGSVWGRLHIEELWAAAQLPGACLQGA